MWVMVDRQAAAGTDWLKRGPLIYLIRLLAYSLILIAIADKNWPKRKV